MFKKPFSCNRNTKLKKALLKKVRMSTEKSLPEFANLSEEETSLIIPSRSDAFEITCIKGSRVAFYSYKEVPVLIDLTGKGQIIPTIFGMWLLPSQMLILKVDNGAFPHILNGADLMAPGIAYSIDEIPSFEENQAIGIAHPCGKVIAVGYTLMSSEDLKKNGKKGKLVAVEHYMGDHLFLHIWKTSSSPHCSLPAELEELSDLLKLPARATVSEDLSLAGNEGEAETEEGKETEAPASEPQQEEGNATDADATDVAAEKEKSEENEEVEEEEDDGLVEITEKLSMEELFKISFLQGIKTTLNKDDLPIIASVFYSLHMQPNRPRGYKLDIKRSSYKKLVRFMHAMERDGLVTLKPLPKGEVQIVTVNEEHKDFVSFVPHKTENSKQKKKSSEPGQAAKKSDDNSFVIKKLLRPTADLFPVFSAVNEEAQKTQLYSKEEALEILWQYVEKQELAKGSEVTLDTPLSRGAFRKQKAEGTTVTKQELATRFVAALQENYEITRDGVVNVVKGCMEPIISREERRGGHKYVTRVKGLETFLLEPKNIAKELRKKFAASTTVAEIANGKAKGGTTYQEVVIQGKMNHQVKDYLVKQYSIPTNLIDLFSK